MLLLVVALFFISWSPLHVFVISSGWRKVERGDREALAHGICYWIAMSNIWYNPIIYVWLNAKFRRSLLLLICPRGCRLLRQPGAAALRLEPAAAAAVDAAIRSGGVTPRRQWRQQRQSEQGEADGVQGGGAALLSFLREDFIVATDAQETSNRN